MTAILHCPRRGCGTVLTEQHDRLIGRLDYVCLRCQGIAQRNAKGLCADCPAALPDARSQRCRACAQQREASRNLDQQNRRYRGDEAVRNRKNAQRRKHYRTNAAFANGQRAYAKTKYYAKKARGETKLDAFDLAYHRAWHKAHSRTKAQNDREYRRRRNRMAVDPLYRERQLELQRARSRRRDEKRKAIHASAQRSSQGCAA